VQILALPGFQEIRNIPIEGDVIPRSVLFNTFDDVTYLFIALGDGHLISFIYDLVSGETGERYQDKSKAYLLFFRAQENSKIGNKFLLEHNPSP
jgi:hypothetical protein